jgi:hypothetical protein
MLIYAAVTALGCTHYEWMSGKKQQLLHNGYPSSYVEGYEDGYRSSCVPNPYYQLFLIEQSCKNRSKGVKIVKDMSRDRSFDQGWGDGKKEAIREAVAMQNNAREQMYEYESRGFIGNMK